MCCESDEQTSSTGHTHSGEEHGECCSAVWNKTLFCLPAVANTTAISYFLFLFISFARAVVSPACLCLTYFILMGLLFFYCSSAVCKCQGATLARAVALFELKKEIEGFQNLDDHWKVRVKMASQRRRSMESEKPKQRNQRKSKYDRRRREGGWEGEAQWPHVTCDVGSTTHQGECVCLCVEDGEEDADRLWLLAFY